MCADAGSWRRKDHVRSSLARWEAGMPHGYMLLVSSQRVVCMVVWWGTTTMSSININDL